MRVSILTPTRGRPDLCLQMVESADQAEHLLYVDDDDPSDYSALESLATIMRGPRIGVAKAWNQLAAWSTGDVLMLGNDDLLFPADDWIACIDRHLQAASHPYWCYHFNDGGPRPNQCSLPIVTRAWYEHLGYFVPEHLGFLYTDTWIADIAERAKVLIYFDYPVIEHLHPTYGKRQPDRTWNERPTGGENVRYRNTEKWRIRDARRLVEAISEATCPTFS